MSTLYAKLNYLVYLPAIAAVRKHAMLLSINARIAIADTSSDLSGASLVSIPTNIPMADTPPKPHTLYVAIAAERCWKGDP